AGDNPVAGSDPSGLVVCGDICAPPPVQESYAQAVNRGNAPSAQSQQIDNCGERRGCILQTTRNYQNPGYAAAQAAAQAATQEDRAEGAAAEAAGAAAAVAAAKAAQAQHHSWWDTVSDIVSTAAAVLTVAAVVTSFIPGLDVVTAGLALAADVASYAFGAVSVVNAGMAYANGDIAGGTEDLAFAALSFAGGGGSGGGFGLSFARSTRVLLASGATAPIASLKVGDKVLATNTKTGKTSPETVTAVLVNHDHNLFDLKVKTAHGTAVIHTTSNHPFWDLSLKQ